MKTILGFFVFVLISASLTESLQEGSSCVNFDGQPGICQVDRDCKWALDKLKAKLIKASQLVRCGLKGSNTVICCKDESSAPVTSTEPSKKGVPDFVFRDDESEGNEATAQIPDGPSQIKGASKSETACELIKNIVPTDLSFHIVNGEGAEVGEFPHMAAIGYSDEVDETKFSYDCGGSLIAPNFVLTAGHCVNSRARRPKTVKLGRVSLEEDAGDPNDAQDIGVKEVFIHPTYTSRKNYDDIALLQLERAVEYKKTVKPACLYRKSATIEDPDSLQITGWGRISAETQERSTWLLKATLVEVPLTECRETFKALSLSKLPENLRQSQLCASNIIDGKIADACQGDSGGPIQSRITVKQEYVYYIVGVTSFGSACGSKIPGVYTRVSEYLDWIEKIVWPGAVKF